MTNFEKIEKGIINLKEFTEDQKDFILQLAKRSFEVGQQNVDDKKYTEKQLRDAMEEAMAYSKLGQVTQYINSLNKQD